MEQKLSSKLEEALCEVERKIILYIKENSFYLDHKNKGWAACPQGQILVTLTIIATNLRYDIEFLKRKGL